jgi:hypothetical protein
MILYKKDDATINWIFEKEKLWFSMEIYTGCLVKVEMPITLTQLQQENIKTFRLANKENIHELIRSIWRVKEHETIERRAE